MNIVTPASPATLRKVTAAAAIGNFVEWFDFAVYGFLATIIAQNFFSQALPQTALLQTFLVFAVAFALRPLGGVIFGMLGDKYGRKRILSLTVLMMAGATTLIGLLPTDRHLGIMAPILLTLARCIQGFSAGGEYAGACAYVMEHSPPRKRAWYGSFITVSTFSAFAAAAVITFLSDAALGQDQMRAWGWRIPFLIAAPLGLVGIYLRIRMEETPAFRAARREEAGTHAALADTLRQQTGNILRLGAFIALTALTFYMFTTYFSTFLQLQGHFSRASALLVSFLALLFAAGLCPVAGALCDGIGRRKTVAVTGGWVIVSVLPAWWLASSGLLWAAILGDMLLATGAVFSGVVTAALLSEVFPTRARYTASAITYNLAYTLFGGTAPLVATWLIDYTGNTLSPAFYLVAVAVLALAGGLSLPETSRISLQDDASHPHSRQQGAVKHVGTVARKEPV
ncbi:MHS family proline/betaine transporter-like MFS transporter [Pantoea sp. PNA 14-12]|uniref:MFS transporter n=1 Tax=Pantoea TaxID=53335 RepID=UPI00105EBA6A|nr:MULTISPECIES: MFS transporter [Pantoea]TDS69841.1 MHS family proline/betaine transporter-like MFS transporter [Pantoea sp. PNA 14-12]